MLLHGNLAVVRPMWRTTRLWLGAAVAIALPHTPVFAASPLTLESAWQLAETANPGLRSAQANLAAAEGQRADTRGLFWNNPQLSTDRTRRDVPQAGLASERQRDWSAGISQTFEIAGQHGYRRDAADSDLVALQTTLQETRRQVRADIEQRFVQVLALQQRIEAETDALRLLDDASTAVQKRVKAGEDSRLDGNLTLVEAERGRNQLEALRESLTDARAELASALQLSSDQLPEVVGELMPKPGSYTLDQLLEAVHSRPQLRALALREEAAAQRLKLERASVYPDVTVGMSTGREGPLDAREKVVTVSVSLPLPLFRRNAGGIGRATTDWTQAQIERQTASRDIPAQVRALWIKTASLQQRVKRLQETVQARLDQNQLLSTKSYRAGEIGLLQLLLVNRQVLEGRRDLIDARSELRQATIKLEATAGWPNQEVSR